MDDFQDPAAAARSDELAAALGRVRARIATAAGAAGRQPDDIHLVVVTKFFPASDVAHLVRLGVGDIGENREQEIRQKLVDLDAGWPGDRDQLRVHFIGQLQTNKARSVASFADEVHSVDRARLADALDRARAGADRPLGVCVQVDLRADLDSPGDLGEHPAGTPEALRSQSERGGALPGEVLPLCDHIATLEHLALRGLMCVAPLGAEPGRVFERFAELCAQVRTQHPDATWMSAGMSGDLEQAVHFGATHLRVGSAILGRRPQPR